MGADNFSAHYELATLAEQRDELELAAEHYEKAWRLIPDRRGRAGGPGARVDAR